MRATQVLSAEYAEKSLQLTVMERLEFLEEYRLLIPISVFEQHYQKRLDEWHGVNLADNKN